MNSYVYEFIYIFICIYEFTCIWIHVYMNSYVYEFIYMNSYMNLCNLWLHDFFIYEFICFMNSYMNCGVPRFQMRRPGGFWFITFRPKRHNSYTEPFWSRDQVEKLGMLFAEFSLFLIAEIQPDAVCHFRNACCANWTVRENSSTLTWTFPTQVSGRHHNLSPQALKSRSCPQNTHV